MTKLGIIVNLDIQNDTNSINAGLRKRQIANAYNSTSETARTFAIPKSVAWNVNYRSQLAQLKIYGDLYGGLEYASSGEFPGQDIGAMAYADQENAISDTKKAVESAYVCGNNPIVVKGFYSDKQNGDTQNIINVDGFAYNIGKSFPVDFQDIDIKNAGFTSDEWLSLLKSRFSDGSDMVVMFNLSLSYPEGVYYMKEGGWNGAAWAFVSWAKANGAQFVQACEIS